MKRILGLILVLAFAVPAYAQLKLVPTTIYDIEPQWWPLWTMTVDTGTTTWIKESELTQAADGYWTGALLTINDLSSAKKDSVRAITGFNAALDSLSFAAFAATVVVGDSFFLSLPAYTQDAHVPVAWVIRDSAVVDTSAIYLMTPGASITSEHLIEYDANHDSVDMKIVLQIGISPGISNNLDWIRTDSITYASQDTVVYKAWGAKQATMFRFILDPVDAPYNVGRKTTRHYGKVIVDK